MYLRKKERKKERKNGMVCKTGTERRTAAKSKDIGSRHSSVD